jgi:SAM-dependent methyltransferase
MLMRAFSIAYRMPSVRRLLWRSWYQFLARRYRDQRWTFMNYGYHPPHGMAPLALQPEDEADRSCIQLYGLVAGAADLTGRDVLELSSGRGGGASFVFRYFQPRRMVGIDVSPLAVAFSRARHAVPGLSFEVGDAERLNLAAASFDTVLNVESSHCYGDLSAFLREVRRVLRPNGDFCTPISARARNSTPGMTNCWPPACGWSSTKTSRTACWLRWMRTTSRSGV